MEPDGEHWEHYLELLAIMDYIFTPGMVVGSFGCNEFRVEKEGWKTDKLNNNIYTTTVHSQALH